MTIGVLKESEKENRVALMPEAVKELTDKGNQVLIEKGAGDRAFASEKDYIDSGASVVSRKDVVGADIILKVAPPDEALIKAIGQGKIMVSLLNPFSNEQVIKKLQQKNITSFGLELIPRTTRGQAMDVLSSMATIAGYLAVLDAARYLPKFFPMFMSAAGTIRPAKVLILGAGVAGLQAIAVTRKLGAIVEVFDVRSAVKEEVHSLGGKFIEVEGAKDDASAGGYAVEQTEDFKKKQQQMIHDHAIAANVVICTAQIPGRKAPVLVPGETVSEMKPGSVIIDLAASTGGNCELTKNDSTVISDNQVTIIGNSNYPSQMPSDASKMFGQNVLNFLDLILDEEKGVHLDFDDEIVEMTCATHNGEIVNEKLKALIK